ncbi:MAG: (Fe-S)-binding protein, partial [Armatimonadetes bacterium]|nr:(Fe-S)-binding protein [Armatimonadota bacterium]
MRRNLRGRPNAWADGWGPMRRRGGRGRSCLLASPTASRRPSRPSSTRPACYRRCLADVLPMTMSKIDSEFVSNELARCNRCGYCIRTCPTYRATGHEGSVARARNDLVRAVQRGRTELLEEMRDRFFQCLLCGACTESCLTDVQTDEIMVEAREAYRKTHGVPWLQRFIFRELLPNPARLARYARLISLGKNTGISGLARSLGLLKIISPKLNSAEGLVEKMPREFFREQLPALGFHPVPDKPEGWFR